MRHLRSSMAQNFSLDDTMTVHYYKFPILLQKKTREWQTEINSAHDMHFPRSRTSGASVSWQIIWSNSTHPIINVKAGIADKRNKVAPNRIVFLAKSQQIIQPRVNIFESYRIKPRITKVYQPKPDRHPQR